MRLARAAIVAVLATSACGGDDAVTPMVDAPVVDAGVETFTRDLSCMTNVPIVPATIRLDSALLDATRGDGFYDIPNTEVRVYSLDGSTLITSATTNATADFSLTIPLQRPSRGCRGSTSSS